MGDLAYLNFALFRELDHADRTQEAWAALQLGCAARRGEVPFDSEVETAVFDQIIKATGSWFLDFAADRAIGSTPIFIVGMPRTGTTLLERILGNHPDVSTCGELKTFKGQVQWVGDRTLPVQVGLRFGELIAKLDYHALGRRYLAKTAWLTADKPCFSDKHPMNFLLAGLILKALPQAKILNLRRNVMDTCFSNFKELFGKQYYPYSYRFDELAQHYRNHRRLAEHWHRLAPGRILDVHYEDLVREPEAQALRVLEYCGLKQLPGLTDIRANTTISTTMSTQQVRQPIHQRNIGGWQRYRSHLEPLAVLLEDLIVTERPEHR